MANYWGISQSRFAHAEQIPQIADQSFWPPGITDVSEKRFLEFFEA